MLSEFIDLYILVFDMRIMGACPYESICEIDKASRLGWPA